MLQSNMPVKGLPDMIDLKTGDFALVIEELSVDAEGVLYISVLNEQDDVIATTNPLVIRNAEWAHFWSDMHAQSGETIGGGTARE